MKPSSRGVASRISRRSSGPTCTTCSQPRRSGGRKNAETTVSDASITYIQTAWLMNQAFHWSDRGSASRS